MNIFCRQITCLCLFQVKRGRLFSSKFLSENLLLLPAPTILAVSIQSSASIYKNYKSHRESIGHFVETFDKSKLYA